MSPIISLLFVNVWRFAWNQWEWGYLVCFSSKVTVSDFSEYGYAVLERELDTQIVAQWGGQQEFFWCLLFEGSVAARLHALNDPLNIDPRTLQLFKGSIPEIADFLYISNCTQSHYYGRVITWTQSH